MIQRIRKALVLIGPYPYNPYLIFLFFFAFFFSRFVTLVAQLPAGPERWKAGGVIILIALIPATIFSGVGWLFQKYRFWSSSNLIFYILEVSASLYVFKFYTPLINPVLEDLFSYHYRAVVSQSNNIFVATLVLVLITFALMHQAERKITDRLNAANELVRQLKADREELVNLDEAIRRQTSRFLHDRVQSDLMVVGIKLKSVSDKSSDEVNEVIELAIARLENSRGKDLKDLIRTLSPNFEVGGLKGSLDVLVRQYESSTSISVQIDSETEKLDSQYLLGIYRIIEQALLNSFVHGPAKKVLVTVATSSAGATEISIADDGPGTDLTKIQSGVGSAIMDSWVGILEGKKTVDTVPGHGYRLVVKFPA